MTPEAVGLQGFPAADHLKIRVAINNPYLGLLDQVRVPIRPEQKIALEGVSLVFGAASINRGFAVIVFFCRALFIFFFNAAHNKG